jgi:DNA-directed RNA polymerase sigma subunit (sigma70/sigma32)
MNEDIKKILLRINNLEEHIINLIFLFQNSPHLNFLEKLYKEGVAIQDKEIKKFLNDFRYDLKNHSQTLECFKRGEPIPINDNGLKNEVSKLITQLENFNSQGLPLEYKYISNRLREIQISIDGKGGPEELLEDPLLKIDHIGNLLKILSDIQRQVIIHRFGLYNQNKKTLDQTAKIVGRSRERVRQIESKSLILLRHPTKKELVDKIEECDLKETILS